MSKRILNVTAEQYSTFEATGVLECGHNPVIAQHEIVSVLHPSRCKSLNVGKTEYPLPYQMRLTA